ncbi:hypothetical protein TrLO_g5222 [Triparma laevis f. longispina]|uniref:Uncharacterized protein n=1 Tax=Triparma laevis f. longispina TaxID=1714387 RepID=A0A9W7A3G4_9STRA|nr:hypothetical protein TrLO_g5222 [Triparma laevis f. longispina]
MGCNSSIPRKNTPVPTTDPDAPPPPPAGSKIYQRAGAPSLDQLSAEWDDLKQDVEGLLYQCPVTGKTVLTVLLERSYADGSTWAYKVFEEVGAKKQEQSLANMGTYEHNLFPIHFAFIALSTPGFIPLLLASNPDVTITTTWNPILKKPCDPLTAYELILLYGYRFASDFMDVACVLELLDYENNPCANTRAFNQPSISELLALAMEEENTDHGELFETIKNRLEHTNDASQQIFRLADDGVNAFHRCFVEGMGDGEELQIAKQMFEICSDVQPLTAEDILGSRRASSSVFDKARMRKSIANNLMGSGTEITSPTIEKNIAGIMEESNWNYPLHMAYLTDDIQFIINLRDRYPEALKSRNKAGETPYSNVKKIRCEVTRSEAALFNKDTTAAHLDALDFANNVDKTSRHDKAYRHSSVENGEDSKI